MLTSFSRNLPGLPSTWPLWLSVENTPQHGVKRTYPNLNSIVVLLLPHTMVDSIARHLHEGGGMLQRRL